MTHRYVHMFGGGRADGSAADRELLGGKGANLAEMARLGLPVPPGFTIDTDACRYVQANGGAWPEGMEEQVREAVRLLEELAGRRLGGSERPLLVSVRSGAPVSMPGMMDTVLNLGMNRDAVRALAAIDERFAWDAWRRFLVMFGDVVLRIHASRFQRARAGVLGDRAEGEASIEDLQRLCRRYQDLVTGEIGTFPDDPWRQLRLAIDAVFGSFNTERARYYRKTHGIPEDIGTAVNVQAMVFGNLGERSATGVAFSRDPATGAPIFFGEWLPMAQGEDVVAGTHTPRPLNRGKDPGATGTLEDEMPEVYRQLDDVRRKLEGHFRDMQDIEFTIEEGRLYLLQTRTGKRTPAAAVRIAVDLVDQGLIDRDTALRRVDPELLELLLRPVIDPEAPRTVLATGLPASPGAASGHVVFQSEDARELSERGEPALLVRMETSPEDIQGMTVSEGILTSRGGQTSHAAVVARGMGLPCVVGATDVVVDYGRELFYAGSTVVRKGDWITIDGTTGELMQGRVPTLPPNADSGAMARFLGWADDVARLAVRANADNGRDAARARELGAVGIGLCRTEHMFFQAEALKAMRELILATDPRARRRALARVLPMQSRAFAEIFRAMDGLPVTIRLLDPPLHEFLPSGAGEVASVAEELGVRTERLQERLDQLHEANPMMGHRGCRLGISSPEIYETQVRAIVQAAVEVQREGVVVLPEIMIPLVAIEGELKLLRSLVERTAQQVLAERGATLDYAVGTMIELPRAALTAGEVARHADFFSFGTNDLTQMTWGFSRDDMGKFFGDYKAAGLLHASPLAAFDAAGVGKLVEIAARLGREARPGLKLGVCGEHGGDPGGIAFFHGVGLDYVSCSAFRVPVARLAAAQAALDQR